MGKVLEICVGKGSELPEGAPLRKFKGRTVFQGNNLKDPQRWISGCCIVCWTWQSHRRYGGREIPRCIWQHAWKHGHSGWRETSIHPSLDESRPNVGKVTQGSLAKGMGREIYRSRCTACPGTPRLRGGYGKSTVSSSCLQSDSSLSIRNVGPRCFGILSWNYC